MKMKSITIARGSKEETCLDEIANGSDLVNIEGAEFSRTGPSSPFCASRRSGLPGRWKYIGGAMPGLFGEKFSSSQLYVIVLRNGDGIFFPNTNEVYTSRVDAEIAMANLEPDYAEMAFCVRTLNYVLSCALSRLS